MEHPGRVDRVLRRLVDVRPSELAAVAWAWLYFFGVLSAYYVIRPIRDELGIAGGVGNLPWLFLGTLAGMVLCNPLFGALVSRLPRRRFIAWSYRFFMLNLAVFFVLMRTTEAEVQVWVGRVFFVWVSVFNMFVVSIFWATCKNAEVDVPPQHWASLSLLSCDVPAIAMGSKKASGALLRVCEGRTLGVPPQRLRTEWSRLKPTRRRLKSCGPPPSHSRWRMCWLSLLHYTVWP